MQNVLLHCCCAPCSSAIVEWMLAHDTVPTLYFYNPNIYPEKEYMIRKRELMRFAEMQGLRVIDDDAQSGWSWQTCHAAWLRGVQGMENEPERGARCLQCFKYRLLRAAETAVREGLAVFTTTLASSRWKSLQQITEAGEWAVGEVMRRIGDGTLVVGSSAKESGEKPPLAFDARNWRKGGLQQRRNELLKEYGFYNQLYCGCEFSLRRVDGETCQL